MLKWAKEHGCEWKLDTCTAAAKHGRLEVLKYARANGYNMSMLAVIEAVHGGHLEVVGWLNDVGYKANQNFVTNAAMESFRIDVLQWLYDSGYLTDLEEIVDLAIARSNLEVLKWAEDKGFSDWQACITSFSVEIDISVVKWLMERNCSFANVIGLTFKAKTLEEMQWLVDKGLTVGFATALKTGDIPYLRKCKQLNQLSGIRNAAVNVGNIDVLRWLKEEAPQEFAGLAQLAFVPEIAFCSETQLQWVKENLNVWGEDLLCSAAAAGDLRTVMWLRKNGCPWGSSVPHSAAQGGFFEVCVTSS